jgi:co-chaperonin GroES (HSP10)
VSDFILTNVQPVGDRVLVEPYYDADKVYSLIIPDSAKNPMSQQGKVMAVGPEQKDIQLLDHILYHPFVGEPVQTAKAEWLMVESRHVVAWLAPDGELFPLPDFVMLMPNFKPDGVVKQGLIYVPRQVFEVEPPETGVVARVGERVSGVVPGMTVVYPLGAGNEIGLDTGKSRAVYYTIKADDLLAIIGD